MAMSMDGKLNRLRKRPWPIWEICGSYGGEEVDVDLLDYK
jgi:hypothetical protein